MNIRKKKFDFEMSFSFDLKGEDVTILLKYKTDNVNGVCCKEYKYPGRCYFGSWCLKGDNYTTHLKLYNCRKSHNLVKKIMIEKIKKQYKTDSITIKET